MYKKLILSIIILFLCSCDTDIVSKTIFNDWKESKLDLIGCVDTLSEVI